MLARLSRFLDQQRRAGVAGEKARPTAPELTEGLRMALSQLQDYLTTGNEQYLGPGGEKLVPGVEKLDQVNINSFREVYGFSYIEQARAGWAEMGLGLVDGTAYRDMVLLGSPLLPKEVYYLILARRRQGDKTVVRSDHYLVDLGAYLNESWPDGWYRIRSLGVEEGEEGWLDTVSMVVGGRSEWGTGLPLAWAVTLTFDPVEVTFSRKKAENSATFITEVKKTQKNEKN